MVACFTGRALNFLSVMENDFFSRKPPSETYDAPESAAKLGMTTVLLRIPLSFADSLNTIRLSTV